MKWLLLVVAIIVLLVILVIVIGLVLPKQHRASRTAHFRATPEVVWNAITNVPGAEPLPPNNGHRRWREGGRSDRITYEAEEEVPPRRLVTRIADRNLPFGGTWTHELTPAPDGGTDLTITEDGEIYNPVFRFVARFIIGYHATMDARLADLARRL